MDTTQILLSISICVFVGLLMSRICKILKLPAVTGYLLAGVLIGCFCLGKLSLGGYHFGFESMEAVEGLGIIADIALGFIAFSIGSEFKISALKQTGRQATIIAFAQALAATLVVDVALIALHFILKSTTGVDYLPLPAAIILGAIATATAPAATLMVVRQYKAKGPLTNMLLPIVALDDAIGLVVFAISFGVAKAVGGGRLDVISIIVEPMIEILASILLGALLGFLLSMLEKMFHSNSNRLSLVITFVFVTVAITTLKNLHVGVVHIGFSSLLTCMMCGTVFCNVCECSDEMMHRADSWTKPLLILFFVISGAELDLSVFKTPVFIIIGLVYIVSRCIGKYYGASISAGATHCDKNIVKYLGITLFPQAGVALGMVSMVTSDSAIDPTIASTVRFVVLFAVLVYEIVGPMLTKMSLIAAGDITEKPADLTRRRKNVEHT